MCISKSCSIIKTVYNVKQDIPTIYAFFLLVRSARTRRCCDFFLATRGLPTTVRCWSDDVTVVLSIAMPENPKYHIVNTKRSQFVFRMCK